MKNPLTEARVTEFLGELFGDELHAKRILSLSNATFGVIRAASLSIHAIGHALSQAKGTADKHSIKQVDRLVGNPGIVPSELFKDWVRYVVGSRPQVVISLDWTEFGKDGHHTLVASMVTEHGRTTPLMWRSVERSELKGHRNEIEDELIVRLGDCLPDETEVTLVADRGFADQKFFVLLDGLGFKYVIRFSQGLYIQWGDEAPKLINECVPENGRPRLIRDALLTTAQTPVPVVVCVHARKMKEPWLLASNLENAKAQQVISLYGKRFTIEEGFRDIKDWRFGMGLSATRVHSTQRRDRLLLLSALAIALLTLLGAAGESLGMERLLKANTSKKRTYSLFRQGCLYYGHIPMMKEERLLPLIQKFSELVLQQPLFTKTFGLI